jgi:aspartate carbamoyltransferase catalytic subunit
MRHIVRAQQFTPQLIERLFHRTKQFKKTDGRGFEDTLRRRFILNLFYEPSTRTRLSFDAAARRLGMEVLSTENAREMSSAVKGESLADTISYVTGLVDVAVVRHPQEGAAEEAASRNEVSIVNGGDGTGQHPTQAFLDLFTIEEFMGRLTNITLVCVGDLARGRTVRSLVYLFAKYPGNSIIFVSPPEYRIGEDIKEYLTRHNVPFSETSNLSETLEYGDVFYCTRPQLERPNPYGHVICDERMTEIRVEFTMRLVHVERMKPTAIILHPLPRTFELHPEIDSNPRAKWFPQAHNGLWTRMSILEYVCVG